METGIDWGKQSQMARFVLLDHLTGFRLSAPLRPEWRFSYRANSVRLFAFVVPVLRIWTLEFDICFAQFYKMGDIRIFQDFDDFSQGQSNLTATTTAKRGYILDYLPPSTEQTVSANFYITMSFKINSLIPNSLARPSAICSLNPVHRRTGMSARSFISSPAGFSPYVTK